MLGSGRALLSLARALDLHDLEDVEQELTQVLNTRQASEDESVWAGTAQFFLTWDGRIQDELAQRDEGLANGYLLGRGLSECYWGLGPEDSWLAEGTATGASPAYLFGDERRRELSRMLGRVEPDVMHVMSGAAISGSLEAWGDVARDPAWCRAADLRDQLYEQIRRWYQLVVLDQDPTTMIEPYAHLGSLRWVGRVLRLFWAQLLLALVAIVLVTAFFSVLGGPSPEWLSSLLATSGVTVFAAAGLLARSRGAAQRLALRLRQDVYTDLVAISITVLPSADASSASALRLARKRLESAVRRRPLTSPTPPEPK